jgi:hypothetical protein
LQGDEEPASSSLFVLEAPPICEQTRRYLTRGREKPISQGHAWMYSVAQLSDTRGIAAGTGGHPRAQA